MFKNVFGSLLKIGNISSKKDTQIAKHTGGPVQQINGNGNNVTIYQDYRTQTLSSPILSEQAKSILEQSRVFSQDTLLVFADRVSTLGATRSECRNLNITDAASLLNDIATLENAGYLIRHENDDPRGAVRKYRITANGLCFDKEKSALLSAQAQSILHQIQKENATKIMVLCTGDVLFYPELGGNGKPLDIVDTSQVLNDIASLEQNGLLSPCPDRTTGVRDYIITAKGRLHNNS